MGEILYKYTTLESLALILKSKCIRLNPLIAMDDLQEAETSDEIKSSWMDQPLESIAMWKLYSNMSCGVRIGLQRFPFKKYTVTSEDMKKAFPNAEISGTEADLIVPIEECFSDNYLLLNFLYNKSLEKVEYTDETNLLSPKLFDISPQRISMRSAELGKYKNTYWEFQNEERYDFQQIVSEIRASLYAHKILYIS